ncbi:MAG: hypothetical protein IJM77_06220 [Spirochaetia bacterium]|nr:hypothetical protein [Spirochaetia bacterium]
MKILTDSMGKGRRMLKNEKRNELINCIQSKIEEFKKTDCNIYYNPIDSFVSLLGNIIFNNLNFNENPWGSDPQIFYSNLVGEILQDVKKQIYLCLTKQKIEEHINNLDSKINDNFDNYFLKQMEWKKSNHFFISYQENRLEEYILKRKEKENF